MPPLLAAYLMIVFQCDIPIIEAIDLTMEWRLYPERDVFDRKKRYATRWYDGLLADKVWWPGNNHFVRHYI